MLAARWTTFDAARARAPSELAGRAVAIVDDVMAAASTAAGVVRVLEHAGASRVEVAVPPRREDA